MPSEMFYMHSDYEREWVVIMQARLCHFIHSYEQNLGLQQYTVIIVLILPLKQRSWVLVRKNANIL